MKGVAFRQRRGFNAETPLEKLMLWGSVEVAECYRVTRWSRCVLLDPPCLTKIHSDASSAASVSDNPDGGVYRLNS